MLRHRREQEKIKRNWREVRILAIVLTVISLAIGFRLWRDGMFYFSLETLETQAVITEVTMQPVRVGNRIKYMQAIRYKYMFSSETFEGLEYAGKSVGKVKAGDTLQIQVLIRKPKISQIVKD